MQDHTQALLDDASAVEAERAGTESQLLAFLPVLLEVGQMAARRESLVQMAEIAEADPAIAGKFPAHISRARAVRRLVSQVERDLRDMVMALRGMEQNAEETRAIVALGTGPAPGRETAELTAS